MPAGPLASTAAGRANCVLASAMCGTLGPNPRGAAPQDFQPGISMYGFWLLILFVLLPAAAGAALAYVVSPSERPSNMVLAVGAAAGAVVGLIIAYFLVRT